MHLTQNLRRVVAVAVIAVSQASNAAGTNVGIAIAVEGEGFFLNPIVSKIRVTEVAKSSLAEAVGIVAGDEITQIEGQAVAGRRARDLQSYMKFAPGETRKLRVKHVTGEEFDATLTKSKG